MDDNTSTDWFDMEEAVDNNIDDATAAFERPKVSFERSDNFHSFNNSTADCNKDGVYKNSTLNRKQSDSSGVGHYKHLKTINKSSDVKTNNAIDIVAKEHKGEGQIGDKDECQTKRGNRYMDDISALSMQCEIEGDIHGVNNAQQNVALNVCVKHEANTDANEKDIVDNAVDTQRAINKVNSVINYVDRLKVADKFDADFNANKLHCVSLNEKDSSDNGPSLDQHTLKTVKKQTCLVLNSQRLVTKAASNHLSKKDRKDLKSSNKKHDKIICVSTDPNKGYKPKTVQGHTTDIKNSKATFQSGAKLKTAEDDIVVYGNVNTGSERTDILIEEINDNCEIIVQNADDVGINDEKNTAGMLAGGGGQSLSLQGIGRLEYGTALQVDTSYNTGVSSDSNCSQYSASSWASEMDTSSSLDPSPNTWNSYIDNGTGDQYVDGYQTLGINRATYSDTSDISGEEFGSYDSMLENGNQGQYSYDGNQIQMCSRWLKKDGDYSYSGRYVWDSYSPHANGLVANGYNPCMNRGFLDQTTAIHTSEINSAIGYRTCVDIAEGEGMEDCEYCWYCACSLYGEAYMKRMMPGDVFYYSSNSIVLCVKQGARDHDEEVTPKSPGLNPNASVFLSTKTSTPGAPQHDNGQWGDQNDSGINPNSSSDFSYVNGDVSLDKSDAGVFSPNSDSTYQSDYQYTDNLVLNNSNISNALKLEGSLTTLSIDNQPTYNADSTTSPEYVGGETLATDTQFTENGAPVLNQVPTQSDDSAPVPMVVDNDLSEDQLRQGLKFKLESYFSRENLSNDSYLQSQMDTDQYVPIATVASLDHVQRLTNDLSLIVELLRESTFVQVDEKGEKVRPNHNRCIVILREIPDETPVEEVKELFSGQNCPKFVNCEFAHNSNWYVTFDSDADAQVAYKYLREEVKTFKGKPIMARIKAKPLIRNYDPRNGYIKQRMAPPPQPTGQIPADVITSSAPPPQFTAAPPFSLMPNPQISQFHHLNGQQTIPFYPPHSIMQPNWPPNPAMLDPSMVLQMNGYQATSIKVNNTVPNRTPYTSVNRNNSRNQKVMNTQHTHRDRLNSNESAVPPRFLNQQMQNNANNNNNMPKGSPRHLDNNAPISNHMSGSGYQGGGRRMDGGGAPGYNSHSDHSSHSNHSHSAHPPSGHQHHHHHHSQHMDYNANHSHHNNGNGPGMHRPPHAGPPHTGDPSQRYAGSSYKSRRRREEEGARPSRSNSSQSTPREGGPVVGHGRHSSVDKQFDYEPTSFPPLPGSGNNTSSGEVFESMLSDVVKGTARGKDTPRTTISTITGSPTTTTMTSAVTTVTSSTHTTPPQASVTDTTETKETSSTTSVCPSSSKTTTAPPTVSLSVGKPVPVREVIQPKSSSGTAAPPPQPVSNPARNGSGSGQKPSSVAASAASTDNKPSSDKHKVQPQPSKEEESASTPSSLVKLSYAQMVQRSKVAEVSANSIADRSDSSDSEGTDTPLQQSNKPNQPAVQNNVKPPHSANNRLPSKEFPRKDARDCDRDYRDDTTSKDGDHRRDEPREQRMNNRRSLKENRENRKFGDRDVGRRNDNRREREGPQREREVPRTAVAK